MSAMRCATQRPAAIGSADSPAGGKQIAFTHPALEPSWSLQFIRGNMPLSLLKVVTLISGIQKFVEQGKLWRHSIFFLPSA
jgi:hypothetical protein